MQKIVESIDKINSCFAKMLNIMGKLVNKPGVYYRQQLHAIFDFWS